MGKEGKDGDTRVASDDGDGVLGRVGRLSDRLGRHGRGADDIEGRDTEDAVQEESKRVSRGREEQGEEEGD